MALALSLMVEIFQNIRQLYDFVAPCQELADHVEFFAETSLARTRQHFGQAPIAVKMFASWTPTFYINLGPAYSIDLAHTRYQVKAHEDILLLRNNTVARHNQPTDNIFTVKFYPGGLEAVLGISQVKLTNQLVPLKQILPTQLLGKMRQALPFTERLDLMQSYLLSTYKRNKNKDHYLSVVREAIGEYQASGLQLNTSAVAERLFVTSKTITRYFNRVVGLAPKQYFALLRARTALTVFIADPDNFVPFEYGYYDWSHFNKGVTNFTGQKLSGHER
ncbi:AraC family transcriptional regulator [Hymenobacter sp.]|uniref:AraC family transcriptional regulator n=1 Tax=Hymenobacter sp. TaxID=1898978 RepID=UPI002ED9848F